MFDTLLFYVLIGVLALFAASALQGLFPVWFAYALWIVFGLCVVVIACIFADWLKASRASRP